MGDHIRGFKANFRPSSLLIVTSILLILSAVQEAHFKITKTNQAKIKAHQNHHKFHNLLSEILQYIGAIPGSHKSRPRASSFDSSDCSKDEDETGDYMENKSKFPTKSRDYPSYLEDDSIQQTVEASLEIGGDDFGDRDSSDLVTQVELMQRKSCKGFTCPFEKTCGKADLNPLTRKNKQSGYINGGETQIYGEWPSYVVLDSLYRCGGVLISNRHVLTAGHCIRMPESTDFVNPKYMTVALGQHDANLPNSHSIRVGVERICSAKKYSDKFPSETLYDFAVLTLKHEVEFNDYIQPACLPYEPISGLGEQSSEPKPKCFVVGVGRAGKNRVRYVQKMPIARVSCRVWGFNDRDRSRHCFTKPHSDGDTCVGDSGGPILCRNPSTMRWTIAGLVSYGSPECDGTTSVGWIGVYTRIPALIEDMQRDCGV